MICYKNNIKQFIDDILWKDFEQIFPDIYKNASEGEISSWKVSLKELWNVIILSNLNENVDIYLEYKFEFSESRCDAIIVGKVNEVEKVAIIELKQHSNFMRINKENDILLRKGTEEFGYLGSQIIRYINFFNTISTNNNPDFCFEIIGIAYLHDLKKEIADKKKLNINNNDWIVKDNKLKFFFKNEKIEFSKYLSNLFKDAKRSEFINDYEKTKYLRGYKTTSVLKNKINDKEIILTDKQVKIAKEIKTVVKAPDNNKKLFIIEGDAGTGKTIFLYYLFLYFKNINKYKDVSYIMARNHTYVKNVNAHLAEGYKFKPSSYIEKKFKKQNQIMLLDEAQRITMNQIIKAMEYSKAVILCMDEKQKINSRDNVTKKWIINQFKEKYPDGTCFEYKLDNKIRFLNNIEYISMVDSLFSESDNYINNLKSNIKLFNNQSKMHQELIELASSNKNLAIKAFSVDDNDKLFEVNWLNSHYRMNEIASIYYVHGLEVDYVIIYLSKNIKINNCNYISFKNKIKTNRLRTLLTRALVGAYIYCEDENLYKIIDKKLNPN
ncbi:hypothetical protein SLITO_v1c04300 [Spiroplasma litorale]|uniref:Schlafen group 3-like DNA/RNA helicase domain-containing protein n=1 Tax=Spiroplasma litorale TaxID=216942 RepID=A0A0K1W1N4_9MOLU|nr:DNA/RNA helicase domain-containing protein [Spiroplasma litorale]AKX34083.1 hypothetical protein SLITO_v1c04300 [Spiroplasma litorale]